MKTATTHQAKTHLSRLLKEVQTGETVIILSGNVPVAQLTSVQPPGARRPKVGTHTSEPVGYTEESFRPLMDEELEEWGL